MKTLRLIAILITMTASAVSANAQFVRFSFGVEGGGLGSYQFSGQQLSPGFGYGGYGGVGFELRLGHVFGLGIETNYRYQTGKHNFTAEPYNGELSVRLSQQYIDIPMTIHLWMGQTAIFEAGFLQSILVGSCYEEGDFSMAVDPGALKYHIGVLAGFKFNLSRLLYLNIRGTYSLSGTYNIIGQSYPAATLSVGLGVRVYSYRKSAFK
ncbi:MAG TPA: PorT family protein [Candidatus Coprenecus stercoravium]|uniref:PorT family protein n=1 Tax=Candidatus Coprenecus stercoravium TaxID=2840735 RepID=A0A9D2K9Y6_9BACT|nr:PorT family protein [Candidatus Coprenecus stercoravium]